MASVVQLPACTGGPAENSFGRPSGTSAIAFDRPRASLIRQRVGYRPTAAVPSAQGILELQERMPCSYLHEHLGVDRRCGWDRPCRSALPWAGQSSGFESNLTAFTRYIGIDYSGATTASRFRCGISRSISSDPSAIGQTDGDHTYVRDSLSGNGATRTGSPRWRRLTEERVRASLSRLFISTCQGRWQSRRMRGYRGGSFGKGWGRASTLRGLLLLRRQRARLSEGVCDEEVHLEPPEAADAKSFGVTFIAL